MMKNKSIMNNCFFNSWKTDCNISLPFSKQNGVTEDVVFGKSNASNMRLHISTIRGNVTSEFVVAKSEPPGRITLWNPWIVFQHLSYDITYVLRRSSRSNWLQKEVFSVT